MDKNLGLKALLLSIISTVLTSNVLAADAFGAWSLGGQGAEVLIDFANGVTWYEITTFPELGFFIAIWAAMYFLSLKFIDMIWTVMTTRINLGSKNRYKVGGDSSDKAEKGLAVAASFIATQYLGGLIGPLLGGAFALFGAMLAITVVIIFYYFIQGASTVTGSSSSSGGGFGSSFSSGLGSKGKELMGKMEDIYERGMEKAGRGESEEETAEQEAEEAEAREQSDDPAQHDKADEEAHDSAKHVENALESFEDMEHDIETIMGTDYEEVNQTLQELETTLQEIEGEEGMVQKIGNFSGKVDNRLREIVQAIQSEGQLGPGGERDQLLAWLGYGSDKPSMIDLRNEAQNIVQATEKLQQHVMQEKQEEDSEGMELKQELAQLKAAHQLIKRLERDIGMAEKTDEELEVLAKQLDDHPLFEMAEKEEQEEMQIINQLQTLVSQEQDILEALENAAGMVDRLNELDAEQIQELQVEGATWNDAISQVGNWVDAVNQRLQQKQDLPNSIDQLEIEVPGQGMVQVQQLSMELTSGLQNIRDNLDTIQQEKKSLAREFGEIEKYLTQTLTELENDDDSSVLNDLRERIS